MMVEVPYQAMPPKEGRQGIGGLEIAIGVVGFILVGAALLRIYKIFRNKRLGRPKDFESNMYPSVDSHKEKDYPH